MLIELIGRPILSTIEPSSLGGMVWRISRLDIAEQSGGILDARADGRAHMQGDLAGIDGGEEIRAEKRYQAERGDDARAGSR